VTPTCFKPYPKAFFVSTSRLCQQPPECPQSLLAIKNYITVIQGMQEKFFRIFSS